jgi:hypothetical protein
MMKMFVLMTQWKEGDPEVSGVFSSFNRAVAYFVRTEFKDATMSVAEMQTKVAQVALKMAHSTDDEDYADFGNTRAWVEEHEVDAYCEAFELEAKG